MNEVHIAVHTARSAGRKSADFGRFDSFQTRPGNERGVKKVMAKEKSKQNKGNRQEANNRTPMNNVNHSKNENANNQNANNNKSPH